MLMARCARYKTCSGVLCNLQSVYTLHCYTVKRRGIMGAYSSSIVHRPIMYLSASSLTVPVVVFIDEVAMSSQNDGMSIDYSFL